MRADRVVGGARRRAAGRGAARGLVNRRGATAVIVAVCLVPLTGMLALAVDVGMLYRERRIAQTAADAAALAWANERHRGLSTATASSALQREATRNGFTHNANGAVVWSSSPPSSGYFTAVDAVEVIVSRNVPALFASIFGQGTKTVRARAVATYDAAPSNACVYVLNPTAPNALNLTSNGQLNAPGCAVVVNSTATPAVNAQSSSGLVASSVATSGTYTTSSNGSITPTPHERVPPSPNPLAQIVMPTIPTTCVTVPDVRNNNSPMALAPDGTGNLAICGGLRVRGNGTLNLASGTYFMVGGGLSVESNGNLNGSGVTFVNTTRAGAPAFGVYNFASNSNVTLSATTTGPLKGILLYQDPAHGVGTTATFASNTNQSIQGSFYLPTATIQFGSNQPTTVIGQIVADKVVLATSGGLNLPAPTAATSQYYAAKRVTLVE